MPPESIEKNSRCPDDLILLALVQGDADPGTAAGLDEHLDACPECRETLGMLASGLRPTQNRSLPKTLGRFEVGEALGEGAMGRVHRGWDPELDRAVALKLLHDATDSAKGRARLLREAQAMAKLSAPEVLTVYEVGAEGDVVFIAMELGEKTLRMTMEQRVAPEVLMRALVQAGRGLAAAHHRGIQHRDFKPENVLLMPDGRAKVADFGLVGVGESTGPLGALTLTQTGALLGTPLYMAPERLAGERGGARSDQYAFCVTLWEAWEGERPFEATNIEALSDAIKRGPPAAKCMPRRIERLLRRGLQAKPQERHPSMDALLDALESRRPSSWRMARRLAAAALLAVVGTLAAFLGSPPRGESTPEAAALPHPAAGLELPTMPPTEAWKAERLERWRREWEATRETLLARSPEPRAAECLRRLGAEVGPWARSEAVVLPWSPSSCAAGAEALAPALDEARRSFWNGELSAANAALPEPPETSEQALLGARIARLETRYDDAETLAQSALFLARNASDPWREAEAWLLRIAVLGSRGAYERAARELPHAEHAVLAIAPEFRSSLEQSLRHQKGIIAVQLGDFARARRALETGLEERQRSLGQNAVELAPFHTTLGHLNRLEGRLSQALVHHRRAETLNRRVSPEHLRVATDLHNIGGILRQQQRWEQAIGYYERALHLRRSHLGQEHPEVALGLNSLGLVHFERGHDEEAKVHWEQARGIFAALDHDDASIPEHNLALVHLNLGEPAQALRMALSALHRDEERLGPDAKRVAAELITVAKALVRLHRRSEARLRLDRAREIAELLGDPHLADEAGAVLSAPREAQRRPQHARPSRAHAVVRRHEENNSEGSRDANAESNSEHSGAPGENTNGAGSGAIASERASAPGETPQVAPIHRPGGSGFYGGGQAWE